MPLKTMEAFLDHGTVERTVDTSYDEAERVLERLYEEAVIALDALTATLEDEGIDAFVTSYDDLLAGVEEKKAALASAD